MNEQAPEGKPSAPGKLSPPPWPSFGARPPDSVAEDTYLSDLDAADAELRDSGGRDSADHDSSIGLDSAQDDGPIGLDSAQDDGPIGLDSAQDDDPDSEVADSDLGDPDAVILPDSATTRANTSPDAAPPTDASRVDADPDHLVILPDSATFRRHAAPDAAVTPAIAMIRPPTDPYAVPAPASAMVPPPAHSDTVPAPASAMAHSATGPDAPAGPAAVPASVGATSSSVTERAPDRVATMAATNPPGPNVGSDLEPGRVAGTDAAGSFDLGARHEQWRSIQSAFVDDPRRSVAAAADLAAQVVGELVASAQEHERALRGEWDRDGADTEDLRNALRHYRSFLERLTAL